MMPTATTLALALAATHRMVNRIARHAARNAAATQPAIAPGLAQHNVYVVGVADLPDRAVALTVNQANLARRHFDGHVIAFASRDLRRHPRPPTNLPAMPAMQLNVMDGHAGDNLFQRQRIAQGQLRVGTTHQVRADLQTEWRYDVPLLAVGIL